MNKKGGDKIISVYWFAIIFIVATGIVYMVLSFYGKPYDIREIEVDLLTDKIEDAKICYQKAIELDPSKNDLNLDLGRYYIMMAMQNSAVLDSVAPFIKEQFNKYLNFIPEPINPMKAWTYSFLSLISRRAGNIEDADKYMGLAKELDPFFSPAFGKPGKAIYCPPDKLVHDQGYYLSPF